MEDFLFYSFLNYSFFLCFTFLGVIFFYCCLLLKTIYTISYYGYINQIINDEYLLLCSYNLYLYLFSFLFDYYFYFYFFQTYKLYRINAFYQLNLFKLKGVICKQKVLIYGNMAAKCALEERNPNLNISMSESGKIEFMGFTQNVDFHGNQNIQTLKNIRNGDNDLELSQFSRKMMIDTFDLHGLMIREALQFITSIFQYYGTIDRRILRFIVGKGNHSIGGISRLGPALKKYFRERNISHTDYDGEIRARINP